MAITISDETKKRVKQLPFQGNSSNFTPVALVDLELIKPLDDVRFNGLPTSIWFAHSDVLYEFLTVDAFTATNHKRLLTLANKHANFKLFVLSQDNLKFLRYVEERRLGSSTGKNAGEQFFEETVTDLRRKAESILSSISDMKITQEVVATNKQIILQTVESAIKEKKMVSLLARMLTMDGSYLNHAIAVSLISTALARHCGFADSMLANIAQAAFFHDIGMFKIPSKLLNNPDLSGDELEIIKAHTVYGQEMVDDLGHNGLRIPTETEIVCMQHHEKFNGHGYPNRKRGRQEEEGPSGIHVYARIISIADGYCELVEKSRKDIKITQAEILARMFKQDGSYDPILLSKFKEIIQEGV